MRLVASLALTLVKLAFALAVLAFGWMVFSPGTTRSWPLADELSPWVARLVSALPVERAGWGVLVLALGVASILAALPKTVVARSKARISSTFPTTAHGITPISPEIEADHPAPVLVDAPTLETIERAQAIAHVEHAIPPAPWDFPAARHENSTDPVAANAHELEPAYRSVDLAATEAHLSEENPTAPPPAPDSAASHEDDLVQARAALVEHPNAETRSHLSDLLKKSGDIEEAEGRLGPAIEAYEQSVALRREVVIEQPTNAREARWLWMTLETLAECRDDRGHHTQAAALYREGLASGERAITLTPDGPHYAEDILATRARLAELEAQIAAQ